MIKKTHRTCIEKHRSGDCRFFMRMQHFVRLFGLIFKSFRFMKRISTFFEPNRKKFDFAIKIKTFFFAENTRTSFCQRTGVWCFFVFFTSLFKMKHDFQMVLNHFMQYANHMTYAHSYKKFPSQKFN